MEGSKVVETPEKDTDKGPLISRPLQVAQAPLSPPPPQIGRGACHFDACAKALKAVLYVMRLPFSCLRGWGGGLGFTV